MVVIIRKATKPPVEALKPAPEAPRPSQKVIKTTKPQLPDSSRLLHKPVSDVQPLGPNCKALTLGQSFSRAGALKEIQDSLEKQSFRMNHGDFWILNQHAQPVIRALVSEDDICDKETMFGYWSRTLSDKHHHGALAPDGKPSSPQFRD
jgi:hypothetical protein